MRLTDITIRSLKAPQEGAVIFHDDHIPGFGVRVSKGGTKSFVLTYGVLRARETLGRAGVVSLHHARAEAKRRLAEYTLGRERPRSMRWQDAVEEYLAEVAAKRKPRTHQSYQYSLGRHFKYGATKLSELTSREIHKSLDRLKSTPSEQQHAFVALRAFMRWAYRKHYFDRNPIERMRPPHSYIARQRVLTNEELKLIWNAAGDSAFGRIVKLLVLTGQRVGEISNLTGAMVGEDTITLPSWLTKNSREHRFPLGCLAKTVLNPPHSDSHIFTAHDGKKRFNSIPTCKRRLDERSGVSDWRLHDLRRTFASGLAAIGVQSPVIERLLNHVSGSFGGIVGVYQRYDFMPEMRLAIELWEQQVTRIVDT
jgi:integrase